MPKVKIKRKPGHIDMTAMTDVAFLLLTFFMLTTKFKPEEPFKVEIPSSISDVKIPESNLIQISIEKDGKVFFGIDGQNTRMELIKSMGTQYNINFTPLEIQQFSLIASFGVPIEQLKQFLALKPEERAKINQPGIPIDSAKNQLRDWLLLGRRANQKINGKSSFVALKGDQEVEYPIIKQVIDILQDQKVNKFNFITSLESDKQ
jgi:biopolymer transport protein ExbD